MYCVLLSISLYLQLYLSLSGQRALLDCRTTSQRRQKKKQPNLILLIIFCGRSSALVLGILVFRAPVLIFLPHHQTPFFSAQQLHLKRKQFTQTQWIWWWWWRELYRRRIFIKKPHSHIEERMEECFIKRCRTGGVLFRGTSHGHVMEHSKNYSSVSSSDAPPISMNYRCFILVL